MTHREIKRQARELVGWGYVNLEHYGEETDDGERVESVLLGSVFSVMPSGKYYMPWANSNVDPCPRCKGAGCDYCGHLGSREAYEDELMGEALEEEADRLGCFTESGDGDPCDIFLKRVVEASNGEIEEDVEE